jgi:sugar lactone lactonase YvrE
VVVDNNGNLWVTDTAFARVTKYVPPFTNGMSATLAIGQPSLESTYPCNGMYTGKGDYYPPPTANTLCEPSGTTFDSNGNLWVADLGNQRVLEFVPPFSTGMAANLELGQPVATAFTSNGFDTISASSLHAPNALTFDSSGNLWVADSGNGRVLEYVPPFSNGKAATMVIGEVGFGPCTQNCNSLNANTVGKAVALTFDSSGNLIVADNPDNRVLIFAPPFSDGMAATTVIGQPNMTSGAENQGDSASPTASTLWGPGGLLTF